MLMPGIRLVSHVRQVDTHALCFLANRYQPYYRFSSCEERLEHNVNIGGDEDESLYVLLDEANIRISVWQMEGISRYTGIEPTGLLLVAALLALTQQRCLNLNTMLKEGDLTHSEPDDCLFSRHTRRSDYALTFEEPYICRGCVSFYRKLGLASEVSSLKRCLNRIVTERDSRSFEWATFGQLSTGGVQR